MTWVDTRIDCQKTKYISIIYDVGINHSIDLHNRGFTLCV
jgi:hypothetical protein